MMHIRSSTVRTTDGNRLESGFYLMGVKASGRTWANKLTKEQARRVIVAIWGDDDAVL